MVKNNISIKIDTTEVKKDLIDSAGILKDVVYQRMIRATELLKAEAVKEAPSDTGELRARMFKRTFKNRNQVIGIVGNTADYAPYVHQGTGKYAKDGKGRRGYWVFVKGSNGRKAKKSNKSYTLAEAKKIMAVLRKKGLEAYYTCGQKPKPFLENAKNKNLGSIKKILGVK